MERAQEVCDVAVVQADRRTGTRNSVHAKCMGQSAEYGGVADGRGGAAAGGRDSGVRPVDPAFMHRDGGAGIRGDTAPTARDVACMEGGQGGATASNKACRGVGDVAVLQSDACAVHAVQGCRMERAVHEPSGEA